MSNQKLTNEEALLPCPFCGSTDVEVNKFNVQCNSCHATAGEFCVEMEAFEAWNRRVHSFPKKEKTFLFLRDQNYHDCPTCRHSRKADCLSPDYKQLNEAEKQSFWKSTKTPCPFWMQANV